LDENLHLTKAADGDEYVGQGERWARKQFGPH
jgi:hypothetical protein